MLFDLKNEFQIPKFKEYVNKLFSERAVVEVKKKLPNRTLAQNSYLHLLLGYFGSEYGCSLDEAKIDFYKRTCNRDLFERKTVNKKGKEVTYLRSSAELTTGEMTLSIDRFRNWSASVAGIYLPAANEQQMLKKRKFPQDVARFFHPEKSINPKSSGIHQIEKASQRSYIPVYNTMGTARKVYNEFGKISYR